MKAALPKVSIGLPVFNGAEYLSGAIDSILGQTFLDFELLISDNGSTDDTQEICVRYAAADERIQYLRSNVNKGASWNFNHVFEMASGKYFKWAAHDDLCMPTFLEKCVAVLDGDSDIVLCYTGMMDIDRDGTEIKIRKPIRILDMANPETRFRDLSLLHPSHTCEEIFGLIRADILRQTLLIGDYSDSDRTLLAELGLFGPFYEIGDVLFHHRLHPQSSVAANPGRQARMSWFEPSKSGTLVFPHWHQFRVLLSVIGRGPISWNHKLMCYLFMLRWFYRARLRLARDLIWGLEQAF